MKRSPRRLDGVQGVSVLQIREALRRWLKGTERAPHRQGDRRRGKAARHNIAAAVELGLDRNGDEGQFTDELIGQARVLREPALSSNPVCPLNSESDPAWDVTRQVAPSGSGRSRRHVTRLTSAE